MRVAGEADERPVHAAGREQLLRRLRRGAVPWNQSAIRGGQSSLPQTFAHCVVVERALVDGRSREPRHVRRPAHVVGVEVGDHDRRHRPVQRPEELLPALGQVGQAEPGVDEHLAVLGGEQVAVNVSRAHRHRVGEAHDAVRDLDRSEHMFYSAAMGVEYREEPCRSALNRVKGMGFSWSLNPYMGCAHRCTFCYVRAFEARADRPSDDRYGRSIRVKVNVAEVLRAELARPSWRHETVAIGAATDPYQPAEGRYRLTRACLEVLRDAANPFSLITQEPDDRARRRRSRRGRGPRRGRRRLLRADARRGGLASHRAGDPSPAPQARSAPDARRGRDQGRGRDGADPPRDLGLARPAGGGRPRGPRGGRDEHLGEPPLPEAGHARALPRRAGQRLAGGARPLRAAVRAPGVPPEGAGGARPGAGRDPSQAARRPGPADGDAPAAACGAAAGARIAIPQVREADSRSIIGQCRTRSPA